ncbi:MAG TPA: PIN domain-containing protein [Acidobacteria bacterium]|nr:PIN domain-containing protein [Acidobacteriota bacterium]
MTVPQPVLVEVAYGIERMTRSKRRVTLQARFDLLCSELPRADWTDTVSQMYCRVKTSLERRETRVEDFDAAIAAHALASDATVVTARSRSHDTRARVSRRELKWLIRRAITIRKNNRLPRQINK